SLSPGSPLRGLLPGGVAGSMVAGDEILRLQKAVQAMMQEHAELTLAQDHINTKGNGAVLHLGLSSVRRLLEATERCLLHRMIIPKAYSHATDTPFWSLLKRLEALQQVEPWAESASRKGRSIRDTVQCIETMKDSSGQLERVRAWIRLCLSRKCLEDCVADILEHPGITEDFYYQDAILASASLSTEIVSWLRSLMYFDFKLQLTDTKGTERAGA
ncbi:unnamed protein product, partial [Chrysoparadoxa australica]